jgi:nucleotide-binding universal stress UspA family protein
MLLAYDGSPKAEEALFVATYVAGRWEIPLVVLTATKDHQAAGEPLTRAQGYLKAHGVQAVFVGGQGPAAESILHMAEKQEVDLIVMGGYGFGPILEFTFGSTVERVLRSRTWPVLVCQ